MKGRKIDFPNYFNGNPNFRTLKIADEVFVDYRHELDTIKDIHLSIEQTFLLYVVKGVVKLVSPNETMEVDRGKMALVRKGSYIMSETLSNDEHQFSAFLFFLSDGLIEEFFLTSDFPAPVAPKHRKFVCPISATTELELYIQSIVMLLKSQQKLTAEDTLLKLKAKELLLLLFQTNEANGVMNVFSISSENEEARFRRLIDQNYMNDITIDEMAFLCMMSTSNFKRKFKEYFGETPGKWIKEKKLEYGWQLIEKTEKTILEISLEIGYKSTSHFIKAFKNKFGVLPGKIR
ncbi:MAG: AraC family transcriptional regulator [Bacteroidota bacterium]